MNGKKITRLGFENRRIALALEIAEVWKKHGRGESAILTRLAELKAHPQEFLQDPITNSLAQAEVEAHIKRTEDRLHDQALPYAIWGEHLIDKAARQQMDMAMRLPVSIAGALMPDAHVGYGLPIGGVLATKHAVIPYAVGVDIGCSMQLSVFPKQKLSSQEQSQLLLKHTRFGAGVGWEKRDRYDHAVLDEDIWQDHAILRLLRDKAVEQLGTSGSGNHFAEFGQFELLEETNGLAAGQYFALLSHSGSRGTGAQIAQFYCKYAERLHPNLAKEAQKLAWLPLEHEWGQDYWQAMEWAGRYALANHDVIHRRIAKALGETPLLQVHNSHNLAWLENDHVVHRKGATPASDGQLGIIPGSMADFGFLVRGKGLAASLNSASHGAGRQMGRRAAQERIRRPQLQAQLSAKGITLIGGGLDESPDAYKPIAEVMAAQTDLVEVLGRFQPMVVRMDTGSMDI